MKILIGMKTLVDMKTFVGVGKIFGINEEENQPAGGEEALLL
jgi:hypothetical protein